MKLTRTRYPDWPGSEKYSSPCWQLAGTYLQTDADWNTRFPFGTSCSIRVGPRAWQQRRVTRAATGILLDLNAPLGEPNRLYINVARLHIIVGLISWHKLVQTGSRRGLVAGQEREIGILKTIRCRPYVERTQTWNWRTSEWTGRFRWIAISPLDARARWEQAHPQEAAARKAGLEKWRRENAAGIAEDRT